MKTTYTLVLGTVLMDLRTSKKLTQKELADKIELTYTVISRMENGQSAAMIDTLIKICEVLGTTLGKLFTEVDARVELLATRDITLVPVLTDADLCWSIQNVRMLSKIIIASKNLAAVAV